MKDKPDLKLVKTPKKLEGCNTFWKVCPRALEFLPEETCDMGKPELSSKSKRVTSEGECPWWINSPEHNYCFWKYIHDKSTPDGAMQELVQADLAKLFGWSNTKTHFAIKEALKELVQALEDHDAKDLLTQIVDGLVDSIKLPDQD